MSSSLIQHSWMAILFVVIVVSFVLYTLITGWKEVEFMNRGVIHTFNRLPRRIDKDGESVVDLAKCGRYEGPVFLWPWQHMSFVEVAARTLKIRGLNLTTGGKIPQKLDLDVTLVLQLIDPGKTLVSVLDRQPVKEYVDSCVKAAITSAAQAKSPEEHLASGSAADTEIHIENTLRADPITYQWGIEVIAVRVGPPTLSANFMHAMNKKVQANADGDAVQIAAAARAEAEKIQMQMELEHAENLHHSDAAEVALWLKNKQTQEEIHGRYAGGTGNATVIVSDGPSNVDPNLFTTIRAAVVQPKMKQKDSDGGEG